MGRRHSKPEQIIHMLREAEIKLAGGNTTGYRPRAAARRTKFSPGCLVHVNRAAERTELSPWIVSAP
jgi:hypothetical protein